jgi:hypothetical protein
MQLLVAVQKQTADSSYERMITELEIWPIKRAYRQFKVAFSAELSTFPLYFVTRKGGYDTLSLLQDGESLFPSELVVKVPEAVYDIREGAKALAFDPT